MVINLKPLIDKIMDDPDVIPEEGTDKKELATAIATQRAKQTINNNLALNLAKNSNSIQNLLDFVSLIKSAEGELTAANILSPFIDGSKSKGKKMGGPKGKQKEIGDRFTDIDERWRFDKKGNKVSMVEKFNE